MSIDQTNRLREALEHIDALAKIVNSAGRELTQNEGQDIVLARTFLSECRDTERRLFENFRARAEAAGYRLVPNAETNLWTLTVRFPDGENPHRLVVFIRDNGYQVVDAKAVV